jgi:hypothetical protein
MLAKHGRLLEPHELNGADPTSLPPRAQHRMLHLLERPSADEGYSALDVVPFARRAWPGRKRALFVSLDSLVDDRGRLRLDAAALADLTGTPPLVFGYGWRPGALAQELSAAFPDGVAVCTHGAGPPVCWCRPPLPGLVLDFIVKHGVDASASVVIGRGPVHRALAAAVGARFEER